MEHYYNLKISTRVSLVVCTVDDYTAGLRSGGNISVLLKEYPRKKPVRKPGGYYVFTDLPGDSYSVLVRSDVYLEEELFIKPGEIDPNNPRAYIILKPCSHYPFPEGATLIRASLRDADGRVSRDAVVKASMLSENCARARLSGEKAGKGEKAIFLTNIAGGMSAGDFYLLKDKADGRQEYCRIAALEADTRRCRLYEPLQFSYSRGALLLPVFETRPDERGEVVICFREPCPDNFKVKLQFNHGKNLFEKELDIEGGKTTVLGFINLG